jgi:hypothetical protein
MDGRQPLLPKQRKSNLLQPRMSSPMGFLAQNAVTEGEYR